MPETLTEYTKELRSKLSPVLVDLKTHVPTPNELNNMMYLSFKYLMQIGVRNCDMAIVAAQTLNKPVVEVVPVIADLIWDHFMGEPDEPSLEEVEDAVLAFSEQLFSCEHSVRQDIG